LWKVRSGRPYIHGMSRHSLAEAQQRLPELIARAAAGEEVVITQVDGPPVVLQPLAEAVRELPPTPSPGDGKAWVDWFKEVQVGRAVPGAPDAAELVRQMRDEGY
jgi:prevent-host-death family protein